jgi:hypothetical protein
MKTKALETSIPAPLIEAVKIRKCILFVGSGLSVAAGFPNWKSLVAKLMDAAAKAQPNRELGLKTYAKNGDLLTLAEFARSKLSQHAYVMFLKKIFNKPMPSQHVHGLLLGLIIGLWSQQTMISLSKPLLPSSAARCLRPSPLLQFKRWRPPFGRPRLLSSSCMAIPTFRNRSF